MKNTSRIYTKMCLVLNEVFCTYTLVASPARWPQRPSGVAVEEVLRKPVKVNSPSRFVVTLLGVEHQFAMNITFRKCFVQPNGIAQHPSVGSEVVTLLAATVDKCVLHFSLWRTANKAVKRRLIKFGVGGEQSHGFVHLLILKPQVTADKSTHTATRYSGCNALLVRVVMFVYVRLQGCGKPLAVFCSLTTAVTLGCNS